MNIKELKDKSKCAICIIFYLLFMLLTLKANSSYPNLYQYTLNNGLNVFIAEDDAQPLVYIEVAVKCGGFTQDEENAGLFHLYEHLMFKGNALYKDSSAVNKELSKLGVSTWNGSTGLEVVNYYFTIPADKVDEGLKFWNAALRTPLINDKELESEKKVVVAEILGKSANKAWKAFIQKANILYPDSPYKLNVAGDVNTINSATVSKMQEIKEQFYGSDNAALFIGGRINHNEVIKSVKKIFGKWARCKNGRLELKSRIHKPFPLNQAVFIAVPYNKISKNMAEIDIIYRAPDAAFDREETYSIDVLTSILNTPGGKYKDTILKMQDLQVLGDDYLWTSYPTMATTGEVSFNFVINTLGINVTESVNKIVERLPSILKSACKNIDENDIKKVVNYMEDSNLYTTETTTGLLNSLRSAWVSTDTSYFFSYLDNIKKVKAQDINNLISKYILTQYPLTIVYINDELYKEISTDFSKNKYIIVE